MKKIVAFSVLSAVVSAAVAFLVVTLKTSGREVPERASTQKSKRIRTVRVHGYLRGGGMVTMKNKYSGYVKKVYKYSHAKVKKGDLILEYDDIDIRIKISKIEEEIKCLKEQLKERELQLRLAKLDPLPSGYRNTDWKIRKAKELAERTRHEYLVYQKLYGVRSISELDMRNRKQAYIDAQAEYESLCSDRQIISRGLAGCYVDIAEQNVETTRRNIEAKEKELALLQEDRKHYQIRAVRDGVIITNSDTVDGWNSAGTSAAVVHYGKPHLVYSYVREEDSYYIKEKSPARFVSNETGEVIPLEVYEVKRSRSSHDEGRRVFVKYYVRGKSDHLRFESTGVVEIDVELPPDMK